VFNVAFSFLLCAMALIKMQLDAAESASVPKRVLPIVASVICVGLLAATSLSDKLTGGVVLVVGAAIYLIAAPRMSLPEGLAYLTERERVMSHLGRQRMRFLGAPLGWLKHHGTPR
jgi:hypothetical protein